MIEIAIAAVGTLGWILGVGYGPSRFVGALFAAGPILYLAVNLC